MMHHSLKGLQGVDSQKCGRELQDRGIVYAGKQPKNQQLHEMTRNSKGSTVFQFGCWHVLFQWFQHNAIFKSLPGIPYAEKILPAGLVQTETTDLRRNQARIRRFIRMGWEVMVNVKDSLNVTWNFRRDKLRTPVSPYLFLSRSRPGIRFGFFGFFGFLGCVVLTNGYCRCQEALPYSEALGFDQLKGQVVWSLDWEVILWAPPRLFWSGKDIKHAKQM